MSAAPTVFVEQWIAHTLRRPDLFSGVTTPELRAGLVRARIQALGLEDAQAGTRNGKSHTWRALFAEIYGEAL